MLKRFPLTLATMSAFVAIPIFGLTSCDSGEVDTGGASVFEFGPRFDPDVLDLSATAEMPVFLVEGDIFTHDVPFTPTDVDSPFVFFDVGVVDGFGSTLDFGRGFQVSDPDIVVDAIGQITTTEGESVSENVNYIYGNGQFRLTEQNSLRADLGGEGNSEAFVTATEGLENIPGSDPGSVNDALNGGNFAAQSEVFAAAAEATGLIASSNIGQNSIVGFPNGNGVSYTGAAVRVGRTITYTPTSTNQEVLDTGQIQGTVTIVDAMTDLVVLNGQFEDVNDPRDFKLSFDRFRVFNALTGRVIDYDGLVQHQFTYEGTFTLNLISE